LCWVALDRGVKIAELLKKTQLAAEWSKIREAIKEDILEKGWNPSLQAFTQFYGGADLDASNLLMVNYGFIAADDPKYVSTVKKTKESLSRDDLMYRYRNHDDFG